MKTVADYVQIAMEKHSIKSEGQLSLSLGLSRVSVNTWMTGRSFPNDQTMIKLAEMCDISKEQALLELSYWRADGEVKTTYKSILDKMKSAACVLGLLAIMPNSANAESPAPEKVSPVNSAFVYYGKYSKLFKRGFIKFIKALENGLFTHCNPLRAY